MTSPSKSVTVVVPSYRGELKLPALFEALEAQEVSRTWEVVLVLDGTPDDSREVAESYRERLPLVLVDLPENQGRVGALNAGFDRASGAVLLRCDDDLVPPPHFVEGHGRHHDGNIPVGVVGFYRNVFPPTPYGRAYGEENDRRHWSDALERSVDERWIHWAGNCSVTRQVWQAVGPYDTRYVGYGWEDVDWGYRLHKLGVPIAFDPQLTTEHRHAATSCAARIDRAFWSGQAKRTFEAIHGDVKPSEKATVWSRLVRLAGSPSPSWHHRIGQALDATVDSLPRSLGWRLVGFSVESAAAGGYRSAKS